MQDNQIENFNFNELNNRISTDFNLDYGAEKSDFGLRLCPLDFAILINFNPEFFPLEIS